MPLLADNLMGGRSIRAALPERSAAGQPDPYTGTNHGNGFYNSGFLDRWGVATASEHEDPFTAPGSSLICLIHPFMKSTVTVTP